MAKKIAVIVGSLRKESNSRKIAQELIRLSGDRLVLEIVEIGDLAHYNEDLEENPPKEWVEFREKLKSSDGVLFITPEYNRSFSGVIKNAIDVGSRPYGQSVWPKKPGAVISSSPSSLGGFGANHHLRQAVVFGDTPMMQQPEAYIANVTKVFKEDGKTFVDSTEDFFKKYLEAFADWVNKF